MALSHGQRRKTQMGTGGDDKTARTKRRPRASLTPKARGSPRSRRQACSQPSRLAPLAGAVPCCRVTASAISSLRCHSPLAGSFSRRSCRFLLHGLEVGIGSKVTNSHRATRWAGQVEAVRTRQQELGGRGLEKGMLAEYDDDVACIWQNLPGKR